MSELWSRKKKESNGVKCKPWDALQVASPGKARKLQHVPILAEQASSSIVYSISFRLYQLLRNGMMYAGSE